MTAKTEFETQAQMIRKGDEISDNYDTYTVIKAERRGTVVTLALALRGRFYTRVTYFVGQEIWITR